MTAKIIAVVNQKGGTGKTTLAMILSGTLSRRGHTVLVVDADPQASATQWSSASPEDRPFPAAISGLGKAGAKVHQEVKKHLHNYDYVVIDCPPAVESPVPTSALLIADLALVPVNPSPLDLAAAVGIRELISQTQEALNPDLAARLVLNRVRSKTSMTRNSVELLSDFGMPIAKAHLSLRTAFVEAAAYGAPVQSLGTRAAAAVVEADALTDEIEAILNRQPAALVAAV